MKALVRAQNLLSLGAVALHAQRTIGYVGHPDHSNIGDRLSFQANQTAFHGLRVLPLNTVSDVRRLRYLKKVRGGAIRNVLLGGGTLVGRPSARRRLEELLRVSPNVRRHVLSVGVEDPSPIGGVARTTHREMTRWIDLLQGFDTLGVRGPRSKEILASWGIQSDVVGDPVLLLDLPRNAGVFEDKVLGINVGTADVLWGGNPDRVLDEVSNMARRFTATGWSVRLVPMWDGDLAYVREAARRIGPGVCIVEDFGDFDRLTWAIGSCHVFVGEKLHSLVLAASLSVPFIGLEYRPKCRDFQRSIDNERFTVRTDELRAAPLVDLVNEMATNRDLYAAQLTSKVSLLRGRLSERATRLRALV